MSWSIRIFTISGIPVRIHLTFVLILVWAAFIWANVPGAATFDAVAGVVAMLLLFSCVVVHELAHSLVAVRFGARVRDIVLLPIGGVSQIEELPGRPAQELLVAIVGPLVSLGLAIVWLVVALLAAPDTVNLTRIVGYPVVGNRWLSLPAYLSFANLVLGIFNLLPAFPMDGGRVLRAMLAMWLGNRRGTAIAVALGQGLAFLLGLIGFWNGNPMLVLVAIFVWLGAGSEGAQDAERGALDNVVVGRAMIQQPLTLYTTDSLSRAVNLTLSSAQADFPVLDAQDPTRLVGLLTRADLLKGLHDGRKISVRDTMREHFSVAAPSDSLFTTQKRMRAEGLGAIPVVQDDTLVGLLTTADIGEAYQILLAGPANCVPTPRRS